MQMSLTLYIICFLLVRVNAITVAGKELICRSETRQEFRCDEAGPKVLTTFATSHVGDD